MTIADLELGRLIVGCGTFGGIGGAAALIGKGLDEAAAFATLDEAVELGLTMLDTAERTVLEKWDKPFLTRWCPNDPVLGHLGQTFIERIPGAAGQPHRNFEPGGLFIQDDRGEDIADALIHWLDRSASAP